MLTAVISDLHLGARPVKDVLRSHSLRTRLMPLLAPADQVVLLGDALEMREAPVEYVLDLARSFFGELGEILGDARVVIVPGNHDHALLGEPVTEQFERTVRPSEPGPLGRIASWMPSAEVVLSYPGYRIRPDVYAIHGQYLDCHNTVPTIETVLIALSKRRRRIPRSGRLSVAQYESVVAPLYGLAFRGAQRVSGATARAPRASSMRVWDLLVNQDGRTTMTGRLLGSVVLPGGVAALNRLGLGPFSPELSGPVLRQAGLRAIAEVLERLGIEAEHAIFGHTHRPGPLDGDEGWVTPGGIRLHNCGNWVYEPGFIGRSPPGSAYWPGGLIFVEDEGPPRLERPLGDLGHEDFLAIVREPAALSA